MEKHNYKYIKLYYDILTDPDFVNLTPAQKWIWIGILLLACKGKNRGFLDPEMNNKYIQNVLKVSRKQLESVLNSFEKKLKVFSDGSREIINWKRYQPENRSTVWRREREEKSGQLLLSEQEPPATPTQHSRNKNATCSIEEDSIEEKGKNISNTDNLIRTSSMFIEVKDYLGNSRYFQRIRKQDDFIVSLIQTYPKRDILGELKKMTLWLVSNPSKVYKNYARFITNWLSKTEAPPEPAIPVRTKKKDPNLFYSPCCNATCYTADNKIYCTACREEVKSESKEGAKP